MIPLKLTLKGIYSYREEQVIDFTRLTESNLFGIFGTVGSGKSTILEAISFALYGETERLNKRDDRNYNMMNLKSGELMVDFVFRAGDLNEYRFAIRGKRNKKHFETVGSFERVAYKKQGEEWIPVQPEIITEIIGLSYENFRRTIIIPQNRFQDFLQLGDTDRTRMMKDLFHLDKYELSGKVTLLEKRNDTVRTDLEARIEQIGEVTTEEIEEKERELLDSSEKITHHENLLKEKTARELLQKITKDLLQKTEEQKRKVDSLQQNESEVLLLARQLKDYELCLVKFKALLDSNSELETKIAHRKKTLAEQHKQLGLIIADLDKSENEFVNLKVDYDKRQDLKQKAHELEIIQRLASLETEEKELSTRINEGDKFLGKNTSQTDLKLQLQAAEKEKLVQLKKSAPDLSELSNIRNWFTVKNNIQSNLDRLTWEEAESGRLVNNDLDAQKKLIKSIAKQLDINLNANAGITGLLESLNAIKAATRQHLADIENELMHLAAINKLEELAGDLKEGQPCPVCGSIEHPALLDTSDVKNKIKKAGQEQFNANRKLETIDKASVELNVLSRNLELNNANLSKIVARLEDEKIKFKTHGDAFKWSGYSPEDQTQVTEAFDYAERLKKEIIAIESGLEKLEKEIEKIKEQRARAEEKLKSIREKHTIVQATINTLQPQLKVFTYAEYKNTEPGSILQKITGLHTRYAELEDRFPKLEGKVTDLKARQNQLHGIIESETKTLNADENSIRDLRLKIETTLNESGYRTVGEVEVILNLGFNVESERKKIVQFQQELHTAKEQLTSLTAQSEGKTYDEKAHFALLEEIQGLSDDLDKLKGDRGSQQNEIQRLKESLSNRQALQGKLAEIILRAEDINTLKQLFKGSAFVNYVSTIYLRNLCNAANDRFHKLTRQKLQLEITDTNNFVVRDFMNDGQIRSVKTLSGGQTFQASLSLALALADSIQQLTKSKQNFFFLDEGFGSLDKESLQVVFDTLKTLRKENRIVGVISHVEEMQQEIDVYLTVTNKEEEGSVIKASWEN